MSLHPQHAAWLLGLEGVALLRHGAGDDLGGGFVEARLAEVRRIVDAIDDETPLVDIGDISVREGYAIWAASYDYEHNPLFGPDEAAVRPLLDALPIGRIADVASGTGRQAAYLSERGHDVIAFDLSAEMLAHGSGTRAQADLRSLPLPDDSVDAAVCTLALTHLADLDSPLTELARVVRQGGTIITSDIHVLSLYLGGVARADGRRMPATRYFASDYVRAAVAAGLEIVTCLEPRWGIVEGEGGPLAQHWCAAAAAAVYRDTPAAIVWSLSRQVDPEGLTAPTVCRQFAVEMSRLRSDAPSPAPVLPRHPPPGVAIIAPSLFGGWSYGFGRLPGHLRGPLRPGGRGRQGRQGRRLRRGGAAPPLQARPRALPHPGP